MIRSRSPLPLTIAADRYVAASAGQSVTVFAARSGTVDVEAIRESWDEDVYQVDLIDWSPVVWPSDPTMTSRPVCIDIGAHIGAVSVRLALAGARVIAVEPDAENVVYLRANAAGLDVEVLPYAVSDVDGPVEVAAIGATGMAEIVAGGGRPVDAWTLDRLVAHALADDRSETRTVRMVKCDVEGHEWRILAAAADETLAACDRIVVETHPIDPETYGRIVGRLARTHAVQTLGAPENGGYIYCRRY